MHVIPDQIPVCASGKSAFQTVSVVGKKNKPITSTVFPSIELQGHYLLHRAKMWGTIRAWGIISSIAWNCVAFHSSHTTYLTVLPVLTQNT